MEAGQVQRLSDSLNGKSIMITGVYSISREQMKAYIEAHGGKVASSVSSRTDYLLAGEKSGESKLKKAEKLCIHVIIEDELYKMTNKNI